MEAGREDANELARQEWVTYYVRSGQIEMAARLGYKHERMARRLQLYARGFLRRKRERDARAGSAGAPQGETTRGASMARERAASRLSSRQGTEPNRQTPLARATTRLNAQAKESFFETLYTPRALAEPRSTPRSALLAASPCSTASQHPRRAVRVDIRERARLLGPLPDDAARLGASASAAGGARRATLDAASGSADYPLALSPSAEEARRPAAGYGVGSPLLSHGSDHRSPHLVTEQTERQDVQSSPRGGSYERPRRFEASAGSDSVGTAPARDPARAGPTLDDDDDELRAQRSMEERASARARLREWEAEAAAEAEFDAEARAIAARVEQGRGTGVRESDGGGGGVPHGGGAAELERAWRDARRAERAGTTRCVPSPTGASAQRPREARFELPRLHAHERDEPRTRLGVARRGSAREAPCGARAQAASAQRPAHEALAHVTRRDAPRLGASAHVRARFDARAFAGQRCTAPSPDCAAGLHAAARSGARGARLRSSPSRVVGARARRGALVAGGHAGARGEEARLLALTNGGSGALASTAAFRAAVSTPLDLRAPVDAPMLRRAASFERTPARRVGGGSAETAPAQKPRAASAERLQHAAVARDAGNSPPRRRRLLDELTSGGSPKGMVQAQELARQSRTALRRETSAFLERLARLIVAADAARIAAERTRAALLAAAGTARNVADGVSERLRALSTEGPRGDAPPSRALELALEKEASVARHVEGELLGFDAQLGVQLDALGVAIVDMRHDCANKAHLHEHLLGTAPLSALRLPFPSDDEPFPLSAGVKSSDELLALAARLTDGTRALAKRAAAQQRGALSDIKQEQWAVSQARGVPKAVRPAVR
ncbi:hypothetical protein KFE25_001974 [Diacronema lutheri]|uniref:Uncharacterized protein n=1 Tax=Diacronema lutheri TaxID=2081491 RepID=A0A8J5XFL7_DIALT|nr:hypothetical protein KFE25_001974 [Diacronema lutheri]